MRSSLSSDDAQRPSGASSALEPPALEMVSTGTDRRTSEIAEADYRRLHPQVAAKIRQFGVAAEHVEEIVQQTFLEAHRGLSAQRFKGDSALDTWVVGIAKKLCLKHHRSQRAAKRSGREISIDGTAEGESAPMLELASPSPSPDRQAQDRELLALAVRALEAMPAALREPLVLQVRGHSYEQIARLLGIPPNLVTSRIHQARAELRREFPGTTTASP